MSGIPRIPRDIDPRRPKKERENQASSGKPARSYGQSAEPPEREREEIEEWEDLTEEPVREGKDEPSGGSKAGENKKKRELREFEDLTGEPVLDEDKEEPS